MFRRGKSWAVVMLRKIPEEMLVTSGSVPSTASPVLTAAWPFTI